MLSQLNAMWIQGVADTMPIPIELRKPPTIRGFDWQFMRVGHWFVVGPTHHGKGGKMVWSCVSRCGVKSPFRADALATGASKTCEACRPGETPPPPARVVGGVLKGYYDKLFLEGGMIVELQSNLKGRDVIEDWNTNGEPILNKVVEQTGLGLHFGWKAWVRDAHKKRDDKSAIRVRGWRDTTRGVELTVLGATYSYEVDLAVGRTDRPWGEIKALLMRAIYPPELAPVLPPAAEDRIEKLQKGLAKVIELRKDATASAELRAEIQKRLDSTRKKLDPIEAAYTRTSAQVDELKLKVKAAQELARDREAALTAAMNSRDELAKLLAETIHTRDEQAERRKPLVETVLQTEKELTEADAMESERVKQAGKADDLAVLLAALERLGV